MLRWTIDKKAHLQQPRNACGFERTELGRRAIFEHNKKHSQRIISLDASECDSNTTGNWLVIPRPCALDACWRTTEHDTSNRRSRASSGAGGCLRQTRTCEMCDKKPGYRRVGVLAKREHVMVKREHVMVKREHVIVHVKRTVRWAAPAAAGSRQEK